MDQNESKWIKTDQNGSKQIKMVTNGLKLTNYILFRKNEVAKRKVGMRL